MDLQKIENFLALAKTLSFTKAADAVFKTQSVLSRQIVAMEEELGIKLCVRTRRNVELTPAGQVLAEGLQKVLTLYDAVVDEARAVNSGYNGKFSLCTVPTQSIYETMGPLLSSFARKMPKIEVDVITKDASMIREGLKDGTIDFAYGREIDFGKMPNMSFLPLFDIEVCYVASKNFFGNEVLSQAKNEAELDRYPFVWTDELRSHIVDNILHERKIRNGDANCLMAPNLSTMLLWIEIGRGFSLLNTASHFIHDPSVSFFIVPELITNEGLAWRTDNSNPCTKLFLDFAEQYANSFHFL